MLLRYSKLDQGCVCYGGPSQNTPGEGIFADIGIHSVFLYFLAACEDLDGADMLGQTIQVDWAFVKGPRKNSSRIASSGARSRRQ